MLELRRIRMLHELRSRGTVSAVANALRLTPSAVSQQLAQLQRDIGVQLFAQAGRRIQLTSAGDLLADHAGALLAHVERVENDIASHSNTDGGILRIAAAPDAVEHLLAPSLGTLIDTQPTLRLEVDEDESDDVLRRLMLHEVDLVVTEEYDPLPQARPAQLQFRELLAAPVRLLVPNSREDLTNHAPLELADLADAVWAAGRPGSRHDALIRYCGAALGDFEPTIRYRASTAASLLALVAAGQAVTLLPEPRQGAAAIVGRDLPAPAPSRRVLAWIRKGSTDRPAISTLLSALSRMAQLCAHMSPAEAAPTPRISTL
jgi:DNA-binding transcriptional LysR family regulator